MAKLLDLFPEGHVILGRYKLQTLLGQGGAGVVYKAQQTTTEQHVAVKILKIQGMTSAMRKEQQARFWREMKLIGKLGSPHTVRLIDSGIAHEHPVMVLEYVDGESLRERFKRGALYPSLAKRVVSQILEALAEAHGLGIVHRDLKPENIVLSGQGRWTSAKVLDFGLSGVAEGFKGEDHQNITRFGQILGTPAYMAPELLNAFATPRIESDIFAVGLILLECLTGRQAVMAPTAHEMCRMQVEEALDIPPAIYPLGFGPIIERACQKDYTRRYRSAVMMLADLDACVAASDVLAIPPGLLEEELGGGLGGSGSGQDESEAGGAEDAPTTISSRPPELANVNLLDSGALEDGPTIVSTRPPELAGLSLDDVIDDSSPTVAEPLPRARDAVLGASISSASPSGPARRPDAPLAPPVAGKAPPPDPRAAAGLPMGPPGSARQPGRSSRRKRPPPQPIDHQRLYIAIGVAAVAGVIILSLIIMIL